MVTKRRIRRKKTKLKGNIYPQKYTTKRLIYYRDSCILNSNHTTKWKKKRERERERDWSKGKDNYISRGRSKCITCCFDKEKLDIWVNLKWCYHLFWWNDAICASGKTEDLKTEPRTHMDICWHLVSIYCMSSIIYSTFKNNGITSLV